MKEGGKVKKFYSVLFSLLLIVMVSADGVPPQATIALADEANGVQVSINPPEVSLLTGEDFTVSVDITEVVELNAVQYDVSFDPSVLQLDNITNGQIDSTTMIFFDFNEIATGTYRVVESCRR